MFISPSMLEKLYVRGSLKNVGNGFQFAIKNIVEDGTIGSVKSLLIDGEPVALECVSMATNAGERKVGEITFRSPVYMRYGMEAKVLVDGKTLEPGSHTVTLNISVIEAGSMSVKFSDEVA